MRKGLSAKQHLAGLTHALRLDSAGMALQTAPSHQFIRAVNYHDVPPSLASQFEAQLEWYRHRFVIADRADLESLLAGRWPHKRPGVILTFDDGLRSHADVVARVLDRYGVTGWFMVPGEFVGTPAHQQRSYAMEHHIGHSGHEYEDERIALSWSDVRRLSVNHEICCHTWSHRRLGSDVPPDEVDYEVREARQLLESHLDRGVDIFAWVGGEEGSYSSVAADAIRRAGFRLSFMTNNLPIRPHSSPLHLQRTNIEATDNEAVMGFQLSGAMDMLYRAKRRRVCAVTSGDGRTETV